MPRHLLRRTQRDSGLILRESDPGIGPLGAIIHDMILLSQSRVRDPEHDLMDSGSVGSCGPVSSADEVCNKWDGGARDYVNVVGGVPTSFPGLGAVKAYYGTIISVRRVSCDIERMKTTKDQHSAYFCLQRKSVDCK